MQQVPHRVPGRSRPCGAGGVERTGPVGQPPSKPDGAEGFGAFVNEFDVQQCRAEVEEYRRRMRAYLECLREESEVALRDINRVIDAFNRRAREAG